MCQLQVNRVLINFGNLVNFAAMDPLKRKVHEFWNTASCGEALYLHGSEKEAYLDQARVRYDLEPYIVDFAEFDTVAGQKVLEIGVGLGADHQRFAEAGAKLYGVDFTQRAIEHTRKRLSLFGLGSNLWVGDAQALPLQNEQFDVVYSWGVLHHTPETPKAIEEVHRVLRTGGVARVMIYHKWSLVGFMLWLRYALLRLRPWTPLREIYSKYLESPGTKAYSRHEAKTLFRKFRSIEIRTILTHGDLLTSKAGQRHIGLLLEAARRIWPRWLIKAVLNRNGLFMVITAAK